MVSMAVYQLQPDMENYNLWGGISFEIIIDKDLALFSLHVTKHLKQDILKLNIYNSK